MWWEVITDALLDTLKLFPFLFLLYILIELMEHNTRIGKPNGALNGKFAPLVGAASGLVPMCGFSVMAAKLWQHRHVTLGTLLAVFIATSDEAFIVLLLSEADWLNKVVSVIALCGCKIVLGAAVGYVADAVSARGKRALAPLSSSVCAGGHVHGHRSEAETRGNSDEMHGGAHEEEHTREAHAHEHGAFSACEHKHGKESNLSLYFFAPLLHALKIAAFILVVNLAFGYLFFGIGGGDSEVGQARVVAFLQGSGFWFQPIVCCLVGLIPNCASSVVLAQTYAVGGIAFGGCLAGLVVNAGLGYLVLMRDVKDWKRAALIIAVMSAAGLVAGYAANAIGLMIPPLR